MILSQKNSFIFLVALLSLLTLGTLSAKKVGSLTERFVSFFTSWIYLPDTQEKELEKERLLVELHLLKTRSQRLEEFVKEEIAYLNQLKKKGSGTVHEEQLKKILSEKEEAIPAFVIWRSPIAWNSFLWVDKGLEDSVTEGAIALSGNALVGVVDVVEKKRARILLLTDSNLKTAVRALRGDRFLAKGELVGSKSIYCRRFAETLKGEGFNYETGDAFNNAIDLRGKEAIIAPGDLLVTSGLDGLFPPGLLVGKVTHVSPLKEGDFAYSIEAMPLIEESHTLKLVWLIRTKDSSQEP